MLLLVGWAFLNGTVDRPTAPIDAAGEAVTSLSGWQGIAASAAYVFFAHAESPRSRVAGEIKDPSRNVPLGILLSLVIAGGLYSLVAFALFGSMEASAFGIGVEGATVSTAPVHLFAVEVGGETIAFGIAVLAILTMSGGALTGLLAAHASRSRMGRDKSPPASLENVHLGSRHPMSPWCSPVWPWVHRSVARRQCRVEARLRLPHDGLHRSQHLRHRASAGRGHP